MFERKRALRSTRWSLFVSFLLLCSMLVQAGPMDIGGQFAVGPTGAASYSISLQVPPGVGGIEPKLALSYSSQSGNGLLGMGWSLSGLSAITRCPRTLAQDGVRGSINLDANDRYCLDGQRLMVKTGTYGAAGAEYRTELESFSKIIGYGGTTGDNQYFKVWTKSGQIIEYGNSADSRIEYQGKSQARLWAVNKISDTTGNYMTFFYNEDNANGDYTPNQIFYTGNTVTGVATNSYVTFVYGSRPDLVPQYVKGSLVKSLNRMIAVRTYSGSPSTLVKEYQLAYGSGFATNRSRISTISECSPSGNCLPPISLTWANDSVTFAPSFSNTVCAASSSAYGACNDADNHDYIWTPDVNGDGRADMCYRSDTGIRCMLANGSGWDTANPIITDICANDSVAYGNCGADSFSSITFADVNADGKADLVYRGAEGMQVWFSSGTGFVNRQSYTVCAENSTAYGGCTDWDNYLYIRLADVDGDGRADLCYRSDSGIRCLLANGTGWDTANPIITDICANNSSAYGVCNDDNFSSISFVDVNGDGLADLIYRGDEGMQLWFSSGTSFANRQAYSVCADGSSAYGGCTDPDNYKYIRYADVNGDGNTDLCYRSDSGIRCLPSNGAGWDTANPIITDICANNSSAYGRCQDDQFRSISFTDLNGDGMADLVYRGAEGMQMWFSTGTAFVNRQSYTVCANSSTAYGVCNDLDNYESIAFSDVNGDGFPDLVYRGDQGMQIWLAQSNFSNGLLSIQNGLGAITSMSYKSLSNAGTTYTKGTVAQYPIIDLQFPLYVVSQITSSNGVGGTLTTNYQYGVLKADRAGRGMLGFGWMSSTSANTNISVRTDFLQDWPYIGLPSVTTKTLPVAAETLHRLSQVTNTFACLDPSASTVTACTVAVGKRYFPYASTSVESAWDLNGVAFSVVTTTNAFDSYGNATQVKVSTPNGYSKTTTNTYANDDTKWFLGRLIKSTVTSVTP